MRRLPLFTPDLPFAQEDANRYLPWVIAVMSCLTVFLAGAGITLNSIFIEHNREFEYRLQIQVPYDDGKEDVSARAIVARLQNTPGIAGASVTPQERLKKILGPWLGDENFLDLLPVPAVVEVKMDGKAYEKGSVSSAIVRDSLAKDFPGIAVDDYREWVSNLNAITSGLRHAIYIVAFLLLAAAVTVVILITRASVQIHFPIVRLLHRMGAEDRYITRQFQLNASMLTLKGAAAGTVTGALLYALAMLYLHAFELPILPQSIIVTPHLVLFFCLPFLMSIGVAITTFFSVQMMLTRLY